MTTQKRKATIDLPLKLILTEEGINFFIRNKKKLNRFKMADNVEEYGIFFENFSAASVQRMLLINYVSKLEISSSEFMSKRQEIMDLSKLIVYGVLYKQFDETIFDKVINSALIKRWNRLNPGNIIDGKTRINDGYLEGVLSRNRQIIHDVKQEILGPVYEIINRNVELLPEEKNIQLFLSEKFLNNLRAFNWFILSRFKGSNEYIMLIGEMRETLKQYMDKARISEYLSLMIMELVINAQNSNMVSYARRKYKNTIDHNRVLFDANLRNRILDEMRKQDEKLYLNWRLGGKSGSSIGVRNRLQVTLYNKQSEYQELKAKIDDKKTVDLKERSLQEFYTADSDTKNNAELGMYYLSYLSDACDKVQVKFDSIVNQIMASDLTVITLTLNF